ncbi:MAG: bifunctional hexulose-6-phosphate synthase/ribonuclease regulator [Candidatus Lokiarchaeota archaeon]|nr:bifunctional hexulose-6-phosphate synthase/ribonuclease regulator [Candidatus Lokiarchaeota archaeon]
MSEKNAKNIKIQVALDFMNLDRAMKVAEEAVEGGVDWLEAGTPLIKSEGMNSVRTLKKTFPDHKIIADMKIMDVGSLEVEMATKAGADIVIILGVSDNSTIIEAVEAARKYGSKIMVDLINVDNFNERAVTLEKLGVDIICIHIGIDQQVLGMDPINITKEVSQLVSNVDLAIAGGLNSETAPKAVDAGSDIVIIGHAITAAENPAKAVQTIRKAIDTGTSIKSKLMKKYDKKEFYKVFSLASTPNISDAMHRHPCLEGIRPICKGTKLVGRAVTVRCYNGDWSKPVEAIDVAQKGDVIVIDEGGGDIAVWGELASWSCKSKGINGVVIDGAIRDVADIRELEFPAFARYIKSNAGDPKGFGEINVEIECGGQKIRPGDWIIGDDNGVIVIPKEKAQEMANRAIMVHENENRIREEIKRGSTLSKVLKLKKWEKVIG